jgi:hypothetical protein
MKLSKSNSYKGYLLKLPWIKRGFYTAVESREAYARLVHVFNSRELKIVARDDKLMRICVTNDRKSRACTCTYVIWIVRDGRLTYISYGVDPKYWFFFFCAKGDHIDKLHFCERLIRAAVGG